MVEGEIGAILRCGGEGILRQLFGSRWREMAWLGHFEWQRGRKRQPRQDIGENAKKVSLSFKIKVKFSKSIIVEKKHLYRIWTWK